MIVWITKYALTKGILKADAEISPSGGYAYFRLGRDHYGSVVGPENWRDSEADAIARAESMRAKKIAALKNQIAKLEQLNFEASPDNVRLVTNFQGSIRHG